MFRIPDFFVDAPSFEEAVRTITNRGCGDLLKGMEAMDQLWTEYCAGELADSYADDDDFFYTWQYETNAYNVVYENMAKLFEPRVAV